MPNTSTPHSTHPTLSISSAIRDSSRVNVDNGTYGYEINRFNENFEELIKTFQGNDEEVCQVAVKTGTAEMPTGQPSALLVGFAPADNPKIAFAVVVENGGINVTTIISESVKNALRCYFSAENQHETVDEEGRIIY